MIAPIGMLDLNSHLGLDSKCKVVGAILMIAPIGMLDLNSTLALTPSVKWPLFMCILRFWVLSFVWTLSPFFFLLLFHCHCRVFPLFS
jgi:hypothetical protein